MRSAGAVSAAARTRIASSRRSLLATDSRSNGAPNVAGVSGPLGTTTSPFRSTALNAKRRTPMNTTPSTSTNAPRCHQRRDTSAASRRAEHPEADRRDHGPVLLREQPAKQLGLPVLRTTDEHDHRRPAGGRHAQAKRATGHGHGAVAGGSDSGRAEP